jgi:hypothetical protein
MKKLQISPNYLIILLLVAASMLLAACGTAADTASAASNDAVEETIDMAEIVQKETVQEETPVNTDVANSESDDISQVADISQAAPGNGYGANGNGYGQPAGDQGVHVPPTGELSEFEIEALKFMREEEKLARDVYLTLYEVWGTPIFSNIAGSEQAHMDAVAYLLEAYGLEDPAAGKAIGEFENSDLQALYSQLVAQGQESQEAALLVGGAIEEIDILDLQDNLAVIENPSVIQVFENLLRGSINHLKGFVRNYESQTGNSYGPQYMSQEAFEALIGSTSGQGNGPFTGGQNSGGRGGRGGGQGGNGGGQGGNGRGGRSG